MNELAFLADELGVSRSYQDAFGLQCIVPNETLRAVCTELGFPAEDDAQAAASLALLRAQNDAAWHPVVHTQRGEDGIVDIPLHLEDSDGSEIRWTLTLENGEIHHGTEAWSSLISVPDDATARQFRLRFLPHGYHRLSVTIFSASGREHRGTIPIIYAPTRCYEPEALAQNAKVWMLTTQVYSLRGQADWGIGDFSCLRHLLSRASEAGASGVGINPLHALFTDDPEQASPYAPSSRLFINPLYLDITAIDDYPESDSAQALAMSPDFQAALETLRAAPHVDYTSVVAAKFAMLQHLHRNFRARHLAVTGDERARAFRVFQTRGGKTLRCFAIFEALRAHFGAQNPQQRYWRYWPQEFHDPDSAAVAAFAVAQSETIEFYEYLQWNCERQLAAISDLGKMLPLGLYGDLAVGIDGGGADAWMNQSTVVRGFEAGAPPDPLALSGQTWGFPPLNPRQLAASGYSSFIDVVRANMKHVGALRIDHVLGFMRMFWVPHGRPSAEGAYVSYPIDDLLAVVAIESHRNACLVIGEDLGNLPPRLREVLAGAALYSYRIVYFERDGTAFKPPAHYPRQAAAAVTTHDLPTLNGFWHGMDIRLRETLGMLDSPQARVEAWAARGEDLACFRAALHAEGLESNHAEVPQVSVHRFLARTHARVVLVQLDDAVNEPNQINVPGTFREYPNWRRRYTAQTDSLLAEPLAQSLLEAMRHERPPQR